MEEPSPFRFLSLPAELRFRIYSFVLGKDHVLMLGRQRDSATRFEDSILLANKFVFSEALPFLICNNVFRWNHPFDKPTIFEKLPASRFSLIRRLECGMWDEESEVCWLCVEQMCLLIREHCPRLEQLGFDYEFHERYYFLDSTTLARLIQAGSSFNNPCFNTITVRFTWSKGTDYYYPFYALLASRRFERVKNDDRLPPLCFPSTLKKMVFRCHLRKDELEVVEREMRREGWETRQRVERVDQDVIGPDDTDVDITWKKAGTD